MTGSFSPEVLAGVHTLRLRQSSDIGGESGMSVAWFGPIARSVAVGWMQVLPHFVPSSTPLHGLGAWASRKRRLPTGAAAKGMPLNKVTPSTLAGPPRTRPCWVWIGVATEMVEAEAAPPPTWAQAAPVVASSAQMKAVRKKRGLVMELFLIEKTPRGARGGDVSADLYVAFVARVFEQVVSVVALPIEAR